MKRFYRRVSLHREDDRRYAVCLDGSILKTPMHKPLLTPEKDLAQAIAQEWEAQVDFVRLTNMPLTQLLNTQIDKIEGGERARLETELAAYACNDPLCYFVRHPADLAERQERLWRPLIAWAATTARLPLAVTQDVAFQRQLPDVEKQAYALMDALTPAQMTAFQAAVAVAGSFLIGLALIRGRITPQTAFEVAMLEELYQSERWGNDPEAARRRGAILAELEAIHLFLSLSLTLPSLQGQE